MKRQTKIASILAAATVSGFLTLSPAAAMSFGGDDAPEPDLKTAKAHVDDQAYDKAIPMLQALLEKDDENADAWNLLGFSYRKSDKLDLAWDAYERALTIEPNHLGANEYLGELYIRQGNLEQARAQAAKLEILCPDGCEELETLKNRIAQAGG